MSHRIQDQRSLIMHRLIARRLRREPALREAALANLRSWLERAAGSQAILAEWHTLLTGPLPRLLEAMTERGEHAQELRQSSPFAGEDFIRQTERLRVLKKVRACESRATQAASRSFARCCKYAAARNRSSSVIRPPWL